MSLVIEEMDATVVPEETGSASAGGEEKPQKPGKNSEFPTARHAARRQLRLRAD